MEEQETAVTIAEIKKEIGSLKHRMDSAEEVVNVVHRNRPGGGPAPGGFYKITKILRDLSGYFEHLLDISMIRQV